MKTLKDKFEIDVHQKISEEQREFRAGHLCVDNLFALQQLLEKYSQILE
jgi:hypothetical protein